MTNTLPIKAKVMIGMVAVASLCALSFGVVRWQSQAWPQLLLLSAAAAAEFALQGEAAWTDELNVGKSARHSSGSHATGIVRQPARSGYGGDRTILYPAKTKLKPVQFLFNACTLLNASGLAYLVYHSQLFACSGATAHTMSLVLAAVTYFLANTAPVASIIGLTEGGNPFALWHKVFLWSFPNYVIGAGLTAIVSAFTSLSGLATIGHLLSSCPAYTSPTKCMWAEPHSYSRKQWLPLLDDNH